jgi:hypothetical protein
VTIQSSARYAWNLLFVNNSLIILHNGDHSSDKCDVVALPFSRPARLFRRGSPKSESTTSPSMEAVASTWDQV